jgi:capsular exopolysaccharide synthesis family protein
MTTLPTTVQETITLPVTAQGAGGEAGPPGAADILAMVRRRIVLAIVLSLFFIALSVGGFVAWWVYFPGYQSEALIECISNIPDAEMTVEQQRLRQDEHERFVMTQAMLLKSPGILGEALKVTAVHETGWYNSVDPDEHLLELTEQLKAAPMRGTNFLRVLMECRKLEDPAIIVNEVVNQWLHTVRKRSAEEYADDALDAALEEQAALAGEIREGRDQLRLIAQRLPAGARQQGGGNVTNELVRQYAEQVAVLQLELSQLEQYRSVYNDPQRVAVTAEDRAIVEQDPQVAELARALLLLEQRYAADERVFGEGHRELMGLDAQIEAMEAKLAELRMERLNDRRADIREAANAAYENTQHALFLAQENLLKAESALQDQDQMLFDYFNLEGEITQKVEYAQQLSEYVKSLTRIKTQRTAIRVNIAQPATDPLKRSSPDLLLLPFGIVASLVLSLAIVLSLELLDTSVRTSQDIVRHLDIAMLGLIPHTDDEEVAIERIETAVRDVPRSMVAEAFRRTRTSLQFSAPAESQRSIVVTSPRPDDGKTTVACNLAMAVAQGGRRVLLVDANFRRPRLKHIFENIPDRGLSNLLIGDGTLSSSAVQSNVPMLDLLGSGPTPPNPVELLNSEPARALLVEATGKYDQVIIDTAPVLLASDALVLGPAVDGVILVVRAKLNSRGIARRACGLLTDVGAHLFGAVLNAAQVTRGGYFREQLRAYYDYQADVEVTAPTKPVIPPQHEPPPFDERAS